MNEKDKNDVLECTKELQSAMFRDLDPHEAFSELHKKYDNRIIDVAMELLKQSREHLDSPNNPISECISRCMSKLPDGLMKEVGKESFNVDKFYNICVEGYKHFMNDDIGRAMPIVFIYIKSNKKIGVLPIEVPEGSGKSPMDYLKTIVYQENPDAYCFCGEASMSQGMDKDMASKYSYGDIIDNPSSKDIMIIQGNTKKGDNNINRIFDIITNKNGRLEFKEMKEIESGNMESDKLP